MLSPSQEHCYCCRREAPLKSESKAAHATITVLDLSWQRGGSSLCLITNTIILPCFDVDGWVTGKRHPACKCSATTFSKNLHLRNCVTWSNLTWSKSGKMDRLNKNRERETDDMLISLATIVHV